MLTTKEISQRLDVSEETVRRWIRNDELKADYDGKSYLVSEENLDTFIKLKAVEGRSNSISKFKSVVPSLNPVAGLIAGGLPGAISTAAANSFIKYLKNVDSKSLQNEIEKLNADEIDDQIRQLEREKKKLDLEYQMNLLKIEEAIDDYKRLKKHL